MLILKDKLSFRTKLLSKMLSVFISQVLNYHKFTFKMNQKVFAGKFSNFVSITRKIISNQFFCSFPYVQRLWPLNSLKKMKNKIGAIDHFCNFFSLV